MWAKSKGFTIVELLIVIVVIAILAAISIVAYNGIQNRTRASILQNDLANAKKKLVLYKVDNGRYPYAGGVMTSAIGISATKSAYDTTANNFYYCLNTATDEFAMTARTASNMMPYGVTSATNVTTVAGAGIEYTCQLVGLTGSADPAAFAAAGFNGTTSAWMSWVNG